MGTMQVSGNMACETAKVMGPMNVHGGMKGQRVVVLGEFAVQGDCAAEELRIKGVCNIDGMANADRIDIQLYGSSAINEIGCESIVVKSRRSWLKPHRARFTADTIEGDRIELADTDARVIRGNHIVLGPNCRIERVEYGSSLSVHPSASIRERINS